jgi:hypothetical protein
MMLRGYADIEERKAFSSAFPDLPAEERENALEARRRHKITAVLLHELGHNLGVGHESADDTLMNATYSEHAATFSREAHAVIQRALDERLGRTVAAPAHQAESAPQAEPAAAPAKARQKIFIHVSATSVLVDGKPHESEDLTMLFSMQAARDSEAEVVLDRDPGVSKKRVIDVVKRATAAGLKNFTMR